MRKLFILLILTLYTNCCFSAIGVVRVNFDYATASAMAAAYATSALEEQKALEYIDSMNVNYRRSILSTGGIYLSKYNDMRAMRSAGIFEKSEGDYYKRIYFLTSQCIMPRILSVSAKFIKQPENALRWGPYLYKVTTNVKNLCMQYETIVANGKVTFKDIKFLAVNEALIRLFNLVQFDGVDWSEVLEKVANINIKGTLNNIKDKATEYPNMLAVAGMEIFNGIKGRVNNVADDYKITSEEKGQIKNIGKIFHASPGDIILLYNEFKKRYDQVRNISHVKDELLNIVKTTDIRGLKNLLKVDRYDVSQFMIDNIEEKKGDFYKQRWYIYSEDKGSKILATYKPTHPSHIENNRDHWDKWIFRDNYNDRGGIPPYPTMTSSEYNQLKEAAERATGWNATRKAEFERNNPGHSIILKYETISIRYWDDEGAGWHHSRHWRGYHWTVNMTVEDKWYIKQEVYSETYDSKRMDLQLFKDKLNERLQYYNAKSNTTEYQAKDSDPFSKQMLQRYNAYNNGTATSPVPVVYKIGSDEPNYYSEATDDQLKGASSVEFIADCENNKPLVEGAFTWKENGSQGSSLTEESKIFAMGATPASSNSGNIKGLEDERKKLFDEFEAVEQKIIEVERQRKENIDLQRQAREALNFTKFKELRHKYVELTNKKQALENSLTPIKNKRLEIERAIAEYYQDIGGEDDNSYRINQNMKDISRQFGLTWNDAGEWTQEDDHYTFTRHGFSHIAKGSVKYKAVLTLAKKPVYLLGFIGLKWIRIHRAILKVEYKVLAQGKSSDVIDNMSLDTNESESERTKKVNARREQLEKDFPECAIRMNFNYTDKSLEKDSLVDGTVHLMWASDRIDLARKIEAELTEIYAQLIMLDKFLTARETIWDLLAQPFINNIPTKARGLLAEKAIARWQQANEHAINNMWRRKSSKKEPTPFNNEN